VKPKDLMLVLDILQASVAYYITILVNIYF